MQKDLMEFFDENLKKGFSNPFLIVNYSWDFPRNFRFLKKPREPISA
jgi:hypothetical protein